VSPAAQHLHVLAGELHKSARRADGLAAVLIVLLGVIVVLLAMLVQAGSVLVAHIQRHRTISAHARQNQLDVTTVKAAVNRLDALTDGELAAEPGARSPLPDPVQLRDALLADPLSGVHKLHG
jgi:hypothetical protein